MRGAWAMWRYYPRLFPYLKPYKGLATISVLLTAVAVGIGLAEPWPLAFMVDNVIGHKPVPPAVARVIGQHDQWSLLVGAALAGLLLVIVRNALSVLQEYVNTRVHQFLVLDFRSELFEHAQRLSVSYHDTKPTGALMSQLNWEPDQAATLLIGIPPLVQNAVTLIGMFVIAVKLDPVLALLALTVVPVIYYSVGVYSARIVPRLQQVRTLEWQTLSIVFEAMAMVRVIAAFAREPHEFRRFRTQGETAARARVKLTVRQTIFSLVVNTWTACGTALVLGVGAYHVVTSQLSVGELLVFLAYIAAVYGPLETISSTVGSMQQQFVAVQGAFYLLETRPDVVEARHAIELERAAGAVAFDHVNFAYSGRSSTLEDITFSVRPGQRVAIVGPTGAGKTTLVSLIKRFHDAGSGTVTIDGLDVRALKIRSLRDNVSVVLQVPELFSGRIDENIRYGRLGASDAEVMEAARAANAHDFISRLPNGYRTTVGEGGAQLSVGERQRICIARAFLKDAPILVLDEPTSSVDSSTESVILEALDRLSTGKTTFVIAHRLSTIRHVDLILVVDGGRLVESGTHEALIAHNGLYRKLYDLQMGALKSESLSRRIIASAPVSASADALVLDVERALASRLDRPADARALRQTAELLVQSVEPLIATGTPGAAEIRRALSSGDPLSEPRIATAFYSALSDLGHIFDDLNVGPEPASRPRSRRKVNHG